MKNIIIIIVIALIGASLIGTFQIGEPIIYTEIKHDKLQILNAIGSLKEVTRFERIIGLSDSVIADFIKSKSNKINEIRNNYYYVIDYCIDYYQKERMLESMTLNEWYEFKQNKSSWDVLKGSSTMLGPYISQDFRIKNLEEIEATIGITGDVKIEGGDVSSKTSSKGGNDYGLDFEEMFGE